MDQPRPCGCKGCRTCLLCEKDYDIIKESTLNLNNGTYIYCPLCNKAWPGWDTEDYKLHPNHQGEPIDYPGIYMDLDFLSVEEESKLIEDLDSMPWDLSQSGRRKQNFGPKCNFKKRKLKLGDFKGFPRSTKFVQDKFKSTSMLKDFQTIEQCSLEYDPCRGASIDPHVDDCWIWGERIVTVNLLADSVLTMTYNDKPTRYNLDCVSNYPSVLDGSGNFAKDKCYTVQPLMDGQRHPVVRIPMPRRSLLIMYGAARYDWEHQILREDITSRRVCLAYREFTPPYLGENSEDTAKFVLLKAKEFWDTEVN
ncbi:alpha-ketoglutarate-dependent dioxygenase alkB homolog 4 [Aethina tumida]|uniref:alpha-ketoglutarate-dependent dioxygenase alkB homolog 4 n=1 Tax=Aethina tumida TaxID=116153 RepID=UPI002147F666|nr:alpha-ketoglutarate-dependent dioxygenase alkB homolog 4 [Aethina tumida]